MLTNAVTADATVAPRPQISSLSVNPTNLKVTATFTNRNNYGGDHWHYEVTKKDDGTVVVSNQQVGFTDEVFMNQANFVDAGVYVIKAYIATDGHGKIEGSLEKSAEFTIAANNASLSLNKYAIDDILDVDDNIVSHTVTITSNNLTNITLSPESLTNWEVTSSNANSFVIKLKDSVKSLDLSQGYKILAQETITVTGDVGDRDTSGDSQKIESVTLDAKIVDNAEFTITPPNGQSNTITDNRNYGEQMVEFGAYTINSDSVTLSASALTYWEVQVNGTGGWSKNPTFAGEGTITFKLRQPESAVGDAYNDSLVITPTAKSSDYNASDDPSAITITLRSKIIPLPATLGNPGKITLDPITSGQSPSTKTFKVTGTRIQNITISEVSAGWEITPSNPALNADVTVRYTGDGVSIGKKSGTFKISAEAETGSVLATSEYTNDLELQVGSKLATITPQPSAIAFDAIASGTPSATKELAVESSNVSDITIQIPNHIIVKKGETVLSNNDSIGLGATLTIILKDTDTLGPRSGTIVLTGTASDNSAFSYNDNTVNVSVTGQVNGLPTSLQVNPTIITDAVNQYEAIPKNCSKSYNHRKCSVVKHHCHRRKCK